MSASHSQTRTELASLTFGKTAGKLIAQGALPNYCQPKPNDTGVLSLLFHRLISELRRERHIVSSCAHCASFILQCLLVTILTTSFHPSMVNVNKGLGTFNLTPSSLRMTRACRKRQRGGGPISSLRYHLFCSPTHSDPLLSHTEIIALRFNPLQIHYTLRVIQ